MDNSPNVNNFSSQKFREHKKKKKKINSTQNIKDETMPAITTTDIIKYKFLRYIESLYLNFIFALNDMIREVLRY